MSEPQKKYILTREQIVAIFSNWTQRNIPFNRHGIIDAQRAADKFIDGGNMLFESTNPPGIPTLET